MGRWNLKRWDGAAGMLVSEGSHLDTDKGLLHLLMGPVFPSARMAVGVRTASDKALRRAMGIRFSFPTKTTTFI
jgi:hypothetical protein